jgi:SpoVK/Ycf46/Vps4 family AAA+-type ATPase
MRQAFEQAKRSSPSLLILEEIDAVAPARGPMSQDHKVEELTEILRMIESAAKNGVLVLATTNRKEAFDPAVLKRDDSITRFSSTIPQRRKSNSPCAEY